MPSNKRSLVAGSSFAAASAAALTVGLLGTGAASGATTAMKKCLHPTKSVVKVKEYEYGFTVAPKTPHCGTVTFKQTNIGSLSHNFDIQGVKSGKLLAPHASTSFTVKIGPGKFNYVCDVIGHASLGMTGVMTVKD